MISFSLRLECLEDLHVGSGLSRFGEYHSGFAVNGRGEPWIPESSLKGLIREGCRKLRDHLREEAAAAAFKELFEFGSGDSLIVESLRLDPDSPFRDDPFIVHAATAVQDRKAKTNSLRWLECVRAGVLFKGDLHGSVSSPAVLTFLEEGIRNIKELGGNRNRGLGRVHLYVERDRIYRHVLDVEPAAPATHGPVYLVYHCRLQDITSIGLRSSANNLQFSRDHIRGENMAGAFRHILRTQIMPRQHQPEASYHLCDDPADDQPRLVFSNLYPLPDSCRSTADLLEDLVPGSVIPAPLSLCCPKQSEPATLAVDSPINGRAGERPSPWLFSAGPLQDLACCRATDQLTRQPERARQGPRVKTQKLGGYLWRQKPDQFCAFQAPLSRKLRNKVTPARGSVGDDGLFVEEGLREDTWFFGWIRFEHAADVALFENLFGAWLPREEKRASLPLGIGRGRKALYIQAMARRTLANLQAKAFPPPATEPPPYFTLTFLSDALFCDPTTGQSRTMLSETALVEGLGADLSLAQMLHIEKRVEDCQSIQAMHGNGGYFTPPEQLIEKGSAYRIRLDEGAGAQNLWNRLVTRYREGRGLGEKQHLGYGCFALDHPVHQVWNPGRAKTRSQPFQAGAFATSTASGREHRHRQACRYYQKHLAHFPMDRFSKSQLTGFLVWVESCRAPQKVLDVLAAFEEKKHNLFWNATIGKIPLWRCFRELLEPREAGPAASLAELAAVIRYWLYEKNQQEVS